ncbi:DUF2867 domain-containing protein [Phaeobacter sp. C3_T13_0]|uniref:DUF2867 domain-containing protein n=1 Tax=Phaeobacter cretensis TaxID=3342641 RepID=UPI0039BCFF8D
MPRVSKIRLPDSARLWQMVSPGDFVDGYAVESPLSPRDAADIGLSLPGWAAALLRLRNMIVRPFGLKTEISDSGKGAIFPVTFEDTRELILGADDNHLDFRITVLRHEGRIHMATWVHRHNLIGRIYLVLVMPFHILIMRDSMRRIARHRPTIASNPSAQ